MKLSEYDINKLDDAKKIIQSVYEYNYGSPKCKTHIKRLETILKKLNELIELNRNEW